MRNKILCLICCDFVAAGSRAVFDLQRLRRCVFAAPWWLASERPPLATASRTRRKPQSGHGRRDLPLRQLPRALGLICR
ncbi:hypothetical protein, partial [Nocardia asiatica]|uniref:hypothetical protein n=1 Tax=Nocardia asiatica TaxID=209252 RepID=UPI003CC7EC8A